MNIIKFKDQIRPCDDLFNTYLKGKYAYWVRMRYIIPFDAITKAQYIELESDIKKLDKVELLWDMYGADSDIEAWVDIEETEAANSINKYIRANRFTTDSDLTIDEVKKFRTWLAETLLDFDRDDSGHQLNTLYKEEFTAVLEYYANEMYDGTIKALSRIPGTYNFIKTSVSGCGCGSGSDLSNLYATTGGFCDPISSYKQYLYNEMVTNFSDINFWSDFSSVFIEEFKQYIDNIIALDLPLQTSISTNYEDCSCLSNSAQLSNMDILRRLSKALGYFLEDEVKGNKNFISKALQDWSSILYENMRWA